MTYGIIGAMDEEVALLKEVMENKKEVEIANSLFIEGTIDNKAVVLVKSGIGKVNAAMTTTILMEAYKPSYVINTGSAGGFSNKLSVGDLVISSDVVHHDVDVTAFDYVYGQVPNMPAAFKADVEMIEKVESILNSLAIQSEIGLVATGDSFMSDPKRVDFVRKTFPNMLAAEMEGAAIAQVCYQYDVPFVIIRSLSDIAGQEAPMSFQEFLQTAAENAANVIIEYIKRENA